MNEMNIDMLQEYGLLGMFDTIAMMKGEEIAVFLDIHNKETPANEAALGNDDPGKIPYLKRAIKYSRFFSNRFIYENNSTIFSSKSRRNFERSRRRELG